MARPPPVRRVWWFDASAGLVMAYVLIGGLLGFAIGCVLSQVIFGTAQPAAQPRRRQQTGNSGAAFLLLTVVMFGGLAAGMAIAG